ncbi:MAG TPA: hypothetical protein VMN36_00840 [Verrucomicrobiales bacterium]|nr:hypothetical protein [Verrucomicrobiales bacterium]
MPPPSQRFTELPRAPFTRKSLLKIFLTALAGAVITPLGYIHGLHEPFSLLMPIMGFVAGLVFAFLAVLLQAH